MAQKEKSPGQREKFPMPPQRRIQLGVLIAALFVFGFFFNSCSNSDDTNVNDTYELPANANPESRQVTVPIENADFSKFPHFNQGHANNIPCLMCHRAEDNQQATPKLPGHTPCAGCHSDQFQDQNSAICSICHTDSQTGALKNFPPMKSFTALFNHSKHQNRANCATCHKPSRGGVAMSIPSGFAVHATCYQCHAPGTQLGETGITQSCGTCHQQGTPPGPVSESAKAYAVSFRHDSHRSLNCASCHNIRAGTSRGNQVTSIVASMHFPPKNAQSCATCHNNQRVFGGTDFADCKRCHKGDNFGF